MNFNLIFGRFLLADRHLRLKVVVLSCSALLQNKDIRGEMNNVESFLSKKSGHLPQGGLRHSGPL